MNASEEILGHFCFMSFSNCITFVIQIFNELIQFRKSLKFNKCQVSNHSMINYLRITIIDS